jgi:hypothetical protein
MKNFEKLRLQEDEQGILALFGPGVSSAQIGGSLGLANSGEK